MGQVGQSCAGPFAVLLTVVPGSYYFKPHIVSVE